ncbi:SRPBCC family protein [Micromonospora polyrhachis]|uniref:Putative membrane protein n=1 Tax=Micromonospora polyrhachis TaxID=1282883 RepID=A0A7W7WMJ1_9ACTN|nr:SRPBCC family protein [Micromonospora polyrhachis]MBB4956657.1 putative membrane protein [Micromonospora polyrhachis]
MNQRSDPPTGDSPTEKLLDGLHNLISAAGERTASILNDRIGTVANRLTDYAGAGDGAGKTAAATGAQKLKEGGSPVNAALNAGLAGGREQLHRTFGRDHQDHQKKHRTTRVTDIIESIDVGVPVRVAYDQWTQFEDFPSFMKKVEGVEQESDERLTWQAKVFWSRRKWDSTILEQVPDERIVWRSHGDKGSVDGTVSFHEVTPDLTRILVVLEYHPRGLLERTGNLWRAQGRRVRLELKRFVRHVMTETLLRPDQVQGWRGEIRNSQVVQDDDAARRQERAEAECADASAPDQSADNPSQ